MSTPYSTSQIQERLAATLPTWRLEADHLTRTYQTGGWQLSLQVANAVGFLAEIGWHHPELVVTYPVVTVRLQTHDAGGVTAKDFELAAQIEAWVCWRPEPGASLTGHEQRQVK